MSLLDSLSAARIVPVIRHDDPEIARRACGLLLASGFPVIEVTMTVPGASRLISELLSDQPTSIVGAGTVLSSDQARAVINAGAAFVVSPCWIDEVAHICAKMGIPYLPGAMTPREIADNWRRGAGVVKIFPAREAGGVGFLRAVKSVFPDIPMMPTGGVKAAETQAFIDAGALCVGAGSELLPAMALAEGNNEEALDAIERARSESFA